MHLDTNTKDRIKGGKLCTHIILASGVCGRVGPEGPAWVLSGFT